jgi:hypothetical protein
MGDVLAAWEDAVGQEIARNAQPARFRRDGTLIVHCRDSVWSFELGHRAAEIASRLPGTPPVAFVPGPLPEPGGAVSAPVPPPPAASVADRERAAEWAAGIEDEELRELVARAAAASLARRPE